MSPINRRSLETEIKRGQFVVTVAILLACGLGLFVNTYISSKSNISKTVESTAYVLTQNLASPLMFQDAKEAARALASLENHPILKSGTVYDLKGIAFASFPVGDLQSQKRDPGHEYTFPILANGEHVGSLTLTIRSDMNYLALLRYCLFAFMVLAVGFVVAITFARLTTRKIISEMTSLLGVIRTITKTGNHTQGVTTLRNANTDLHIEEVFGLSSEFESMLDALKKRDQEIHEINQGLEQTVENKTLELKEVQASLIQSSKLSALGEMAAGIAHEINNPLAIICGKSQQIIQQMGRGPLEPEVLRKHINSIEATALRIAKIIKGLKSFSRDGTQDPFISCRLSTIVEDVLELCKKRMESHDIALTISEFPADITLSCRATQLGQVLMNLINNAHDAILDLNPKWIQLDIVDQQDWIILTITDSGSGIPENIRAKIMQPFFTTKEVGKGTGLGLSITRGIIEGHGGKITIDAACPNTRFVIQLPKDHPVEASTSVQAA